MKIGVANFLEDATHRLSSILPMAFRTYRPRPFAHTPARNICGRSKLWCWRHRCTVRGSTLGAVYTSLQTDEDETVQTTGRPDVWMSGRLDVWTSVCMPVFCHITFPHGCSANVRAPIPFHTFPTSTQQFFGWPLMGVFFTKADYP